VKYKKHKKRKKRKKHKKRKKQKRRYETCNPFRKKKDKSFVYDLNKERSIVRSGVTFVSRPAEIKLLFW
jgi:hypothetical protein